MTDFKMPESVRNRPRQPHLLVCQRITETETKKTYENGEIYIFNPKTGEKTLIKKLTQQELNEELKETKEETRVLLERIRESEIIRDLIK